MKRGLVGQNVSQFTGSTAQETPPQPEKILCVCNLSIPCLQSLHRTAEDHHRNGEYKKKERERGNTGGVGRGGVIISTLPHYSTHTPYAQQQIGGTGQETVQSSGGTT